MRMAGNARTFAGAATIIAALLSVFVATASADSLSRTVARADGLPVFDAAVVAVAIPSAASRLISDSTVPGVEAPDASRAISSAAAIDRASAEVGLERLRSEPSAKLGIDRATGDLVWRVVL